MRRVGWWLTAGLCAALSISWVGPVAAAGASGIEVVADEALSDRLHDLTVTSEALEGEARLRVLLPSGYDPAGDAEHPVLFLLHGCCDDYRAWSEKTDLEAFTADLDVIVVMPDAGPWGFYTDWFNNGSFGQPRWESHHIGELVTWVSEHYDACDRRACRTVIGLSMGGFGSLSYAARHPDLFVAAAAFSGAVDTTYQEVPGSAAIRALEVFFGETAPGSLWGQYEAEEVRWRGDNPVDLAANLEHTQLELRTGNGQPGGEFGGGPDPLEVGVRQMMVSLHTRLEALGIDHVWDDYGPGAHQWPYWERDLHLTLPTFLEVVAADRPDPVPFSYRAIEPTYDVYGWQVAFERPVLEFSELLNVSPDGFTLRGTGVATVTTAPWFAPGGSYSVTVGDAVAALATASVDGRLTITADLGAPNLFQQFTAPATALQTALGDGYLRQVAVSIAPVSVPGAPDDPEPAPDAPEDDAPSLPATGGGAALALAIALTTGLTRRRR